VLNNNNAITLMFVRNVLILQGVRIFLSGHSVLELLFYCVDIIIALKHFSFMGDNPTFDEHSAVF
jgi:uncharacterized protein YebE (UPF0316 family)